MPLAKNRDKRSGLKMTTKKAVQFKKSLQKKKTVDIDMVEAFVEKMDTSDGQKELKVKTDKSTKKRVLRKKLKDDLRSFVKAKSQKIRVKDPRNMEVETKSVEGEAPQVRKPKVNEKRLRKQDLPIVLNAKNKVQSGVNEKELAFHNCVSARRLSKKKARKLMKVEKRNEKEKEAKKIGMDVY